MGKKFYYGKCAVLLGAFMMVAGISSLFNSIAGIGLALILMGGLLSDYFLEKEASKKNE